MSDLEEIKSNPYKTIEKLAQSKTDWLNGFKQECIQNREDKKPKNKPKQV